MGFSKYFCTDALEDPLRILDRVDNRLDAAGKLYGRGQFPEAKNAKKEAVGLLRQAIEQFNDIIKRLEEE